MKFWEWVASTIGGVAITVVTGGILWNCYQPFKDWLLGILGVGG